MHLLNLSSCALMALAISTFSLVQATPFPEPEQEQRELQATLEEYEAALLDGKPECQKPASHPHYCDGTKVLICVEGKAVLVANCNASGQVCKMYDGIPFCVLK
jgi:hypothetical protein